MLHRKGLHKMKVGLVRHFEVEYKLPSLFTWITPEQFEQWLNEYEMADIKNCEAEPDIIWGKCYSSDSPRAVKTAQKLFNGPINETRILRELVVSPPIRKSIKLPLCLWFVIGRIAWMLSHKSQVESKLMFEKRLKQIVQEIIFANCKCKLNTLVKWQQTQAA